MHTVLVTFIMHRSRRGGGGGGGQGVQTSAGKSQVAIGFFRNTGINPCVRYVDD